MAFRQYFFDSPGDQNSSTKSYTKFWGAKLDLLAQGIGL